MPSKRRRHPIIPALHEPSGTGGAPDKDRPLSDVEREWRKGAIGYEEPPKEPKKKR